MLFHIMSENRFASDREFHDLLLDNINIVSMFFEGDAQTGCSGLLHVNGMFFY